MTEEAKLREAKLCEALRLALDGIELLAETAMDAINGRADPTAWEVVESVRQTGAQMRRELLKGQEEQDEYTPREISESEAEQEILDYVKAHPGADSFDVAVALKLEPSFAVRVCHRLVTEGKLVPKEDASGE